MVRNYFSFQYDLLADVYSDGTVYTGIHNLPQVKPTNVLPSSAPLPINYMLSDKSIEKHWFHFFVDDEQFERFWSNLPAYTPYIKRAAGFICTDFSIYRDIPEDTQIWNCRRNRAMAYAFQKINPNIIPTAGFGGENTWAWCFGGLPENSILAITTNGTLSDCEARRLFIGGVDNLIKQKNPHTLIVCGNYPQWLDTKYPSVKILKIPNFSQMRRERKCG